VTETGDVLGAARAWGRSRRGGAGLFLRTCAMDVM